MKLIGSTFQVNYILVDFLPALSEIVFISLLLLKGNFSRYQFLGYCFCFCFVNTANNSLTSLLACMVLSEKPTVILIFAPLYLEGSFYPCSGFIWDILLVSVILQFEYNMPSCRILGTFSFFYLFWFVMSGLPTSIVWWLWLTFGKFSVLLFQMFLFSVLSLFFFWYSNYTFVTLFVW